MFKTLKTCMGQVRSGEQQLQLPLAWRGKAEAGR